MKYIIIGLSLICIYVWIVLFFVKKKKDLDKLGNDYLEEEELPDMSIEIKLDGEMSQQDLDNIVIALHEYTNAANDQKEKQANKLKTSLKSNTNEESDNDGGLVKEEKNNSAELNDMSGFDIVSQLGLDPLIFEALVDNLQLEEIDDSLYIDINIK